MIKAVIYDFDDTLIETTGPSSKNLVFALGMYKPRNGEIIEIPSVDRVFDVWAPTWKEWLAKCVPGIDVEHFKCFYKSIVDKLPYSYRAFPGALDTLHFTRELGHHGIISSRTSDHFGKRIDEAGLENTLFDFSFCGVRKQDDPRALEPGVEYITKRGIKREQIVYVGDHPSDLKAAKSAGIRFIGVLTGPKWRELRDSSESRYVVLPSVAQLPCLIELHNSKPG